MRRLTKREQHLVFVVLLIALLGLFIYYYYFPLKDEIEEMHNRSEALTLDINDAMVTKSFVENARQEKLELEEKSLEYEAYLMDSIDEPILLSYIEGIAFKDSEKQDLSYSALTDNELYLHKDIDLNFNIEYKDLKKILEKFEEGEHYSTLNSISIEKNESIEDEEYDDDDLPLNVAYSIRFYGVEGNWDG